MGLQKQLNDTDELLQKWKMDHVVWGDVVHGLPNI